MKITICFKWAYYKVCYDKWIVKKYTTKFSFMNFRGEKGVPGKIGVVGYAGQKGMKGQPGQEGIQGNHSFFLVTRILE